MIPAKYRINIIWSEEDNCYLVELPEFATSIQSYFPHPFAVVGLGKFCLVLFIDRYFFRELVTLAVLVVFSPPPCDFQLTTPGLPAHSSMLLRRCHHGESSFVWM